MGRRNRARIEKKKKATKKALAPTQPLIPESSENFWKANKWPAIVLMMLPIALYISTVTFGFVLDDVIVLSENDFVRQGVAGIPEIILNESFTGYLGEQRDLVAGGRYRPLSLVFFAAEYELFGDAPGPYHVMNVVWYVLLGLLIFRVLSNLFPAGDRPWYLAIPFVASVIYILHPVHVEAVANIKGRDEITTFALVLVSMYFTLKYLGNKGILALVLSGVAFFAALLAKENAITFLAVVPLTLWVFFRAGWKPLLVTLLPLVVATGAYLALRMQVIGYLLDSGAEVNALMNNPFLGMSTSDRYATIFYTLWEYIRLMVFPHPLTHDYYPYHIPIVKFRELRGLLPLLLYLAMGIYALLQLRKPRSIAAFCILFFIITLSITSNIVFSVGTFMNERFAFIPSLAYCILLAYLLVEWLPGRFGRTSWIKPAALGMLGIVAAGFAVRTLLRVPDWKDPVTLNLSSIYVSSGSARLNNFVGYDYYQRANAADDRVVKMQNLQEARYYFERALEIHPRYTTALRGRAGVAAGVYQINGDLDALLFQFDRILQTAHVPYIDEYMEYLNRRGYNAQLADFYHRIGLGLFAQTKRDYPNALKYLKYGYELNSSDTQILQGLTIVSYMAGNNSDVVTYGEEALRINPNLTVVNQYLDRVR